MTTEPVMPSRAARLKHIALDCALLTPSFGIPNIVRPNPRPIQLMWLASFVVATAACAYLVYKCLAGYLQYEVVTKISVVSELPVAFPALTFCNMNFIVNSHGLRLVRNFFATHPDRNDTDHFYTLRNYFSLSVKATEPPANHSAYGNTLDDLVVSCKFDMADCNGSFFESFYDTGFGNCHQFHRAAMSLASVRSGEFNGLRLLIHVAHIDDELSFTTSVGARLLVHSKTAAARGLVDGFNVAVGTQTNVEISRHESQRQPRPYSECVDEPLKFASPLTDFFRVHDLAYSRKVCYDYCFQRALVAKCQCYDPSLEHMTLGRPPCAAYTEFSCMAKLRTKYTATIEAERCEDECPLECRTVTYEVSTSAVAYPMDAYAVQLVGAYAERLGPLVFNMSGGELREAVANESVSRAEVGRRLRAALILLNVYHTRASYTLIEEAVKVELVDLISNVGGALGLFIGVSFLSLVEIVELVVKALLVFVNGKKVDSEL